MYTSYFDDEEIHIWGEDQHFSDEDKKDLWNNHKILYIDGIMAVWVEERINNNPLIHLMQEDDGHIYWYKETDMCFSANWLDNYIKTLTKVKTLLESEKIIDKFTNK